MKLKTRLTISFFIIMFVPIVLAGFTFMCFWKVQIKALEQTYGFDDSDYSYLMNSVQLLNRYTIKDYGNLTEIAENYPDRLLDEEYQIRLNQELQKKYSYLIIRREDRIIYKGNDASLLEGSSLPDYGENDWHDNSAMYMDGKEQALIKQVDFRFSSGEEGSAFIVTNAYELLPEMKRLAFDVFISVFLILLCTAAMLIIWIYGGIIRPLKKLEAATVNIQQGNLDFTIEGEGNDEISELCSSFEEMRKRLKESAEQQMTSERENRELISNIAHDLKTPITTVKGYSEGLLDGVADTPEKQEKYLRTINNKANEMDALLNELTLYSQIDTNRIPYNFTKLNVSEYFNDCVEEISMDLESKNIGLTYFNYVDNHVLIIADPEQLRRVVNNIIGNSAKYMKNKRGQINIRIKDVGDFIQVEIEDNGKGIAPKDLPYIFERFFRGDASRNSATGGSGIGLSIVKKIVEDHGGKIWATSKESVGTVMYFVIRKYQEAIRDE
ncbi:MAG: HAMP domain-containing histidine kinase [Lachnospiraceae bacterium]|uniref:sensor histidine kinase n=1 Tax=Roseburia sp. 1XD42-69 TaxID=2320088 RepID=UPI000EA2B318|nr:HAMP domain-containing sensor histidine kinase [Roseburia sp. 1XD42-69]MCI8875310.1 HAMP domain-containing histidine kinase [Lachnospiraceae bacterium]MCX4318435.1 HAMP domain-containing sensor histidine kinase [Lachnospiraceae bacterium]RKJ66117.1 sensor histidine kinase [Roseburia sp. 1XD42-69]